MLCPNTITDPTTKAPLVNPHSTKNQSHPYEIIQFVLSPKVDKFKISIPSPYFKTIKDRLDETLVPESNEHKKCNSHWNYAFGDVKIQLVRWKKYKRYFSIIINDPNDEIQYLFINYILFKIQRTLSEVEYAFDFKPTKWYELKKLRNVIEDGLTLPRSRGLGFRRIKNTSYYGSNGYVRNNRQGNKQVRVSLGIRIYFNPKKSPFFETLRVEIIVRRSHIKNKFHENSLYTRPVRPGDIELSDYITYRSFDKDLFFNTHIMQHEKRRLKHSKKLCYKIFRLKNFQETTKMFETLNDKSYTAAVPVQMYKFKKKYIKFEDRLASFFPEHPKQKFIFADIKKGFVRKYYFKE